MPIAPVVTAHKMKIDQATGELEKYKSQHAIDGLRLNNIPRGRNDVVERERTQRPLRPQAHLITGDFTLGSEQARSHERKNESMIHEG